MTGHFVGWVERSETHQFPGPRHRDGFPPAFAGVNPSYATGRCTVNVAPWPSVLSMVSRPPWRLRMCLTSARRRRDLDRNGAVARQGLQPVDDLTDDCGEIDVPVRPQMRVELDAREREQVVNQPRHAVRLTLHDVEKAHARRGIVPGRALEC